MQYNYKKLDTEFGIMYLKDTKESTIMPNCHINSIIDITEEEYNNRDKENK